MEQGRKGRRTGAVLNGAPGEKRRAAAGGRWRHGAFSAAAAFARLCERRLAKAKCGKVDLFQPEVACAAAQVDSRTACCIFCFLTVHFRFIAPVTPRCDGASR